jgi:hypothetical protein
MVLQKAETVVVQKTLPLAIGSATWTIILACRTLSGPITSKRLNLITTTMGKIKGGTVVARTLTAVIGSAILTGTRV